MKPFSAIQMQLLECLSDGACHSGRAIGVILGVSRNAVWKHINQLINLGLVITRIPTKGYQLEKPFISLNENIIRQSWPQGAVKRDVHFHLFSEVDSTNRFLKDLGKSNGISVCCAEKQTHGRGRLGRHWASPFGENIYFSSRWELNCCLSKLSGLSLIVSLAILDCFKKLGIDQSILIKWPNDLLWQHKKLSGILIDVIAESNGSAQIIIGIGINVNTDTQKTTLADKPSCSLYEICGKLFDRNVIIAALISSLEQFLDEFLQSEFSAFQSRWQEVDYLKDQALEVVQSQKTISGIALGVTDFGQLRLLDEQGKEHHLSSGDTSIKR